MTDEDRPPRPDQRLEIQLRHGMFIYSLGTLRLPVRDGELPVGWELVVADGLRAVADELTEQTIDAATGRPRTALGHVFDCGCPGCENQP